MNAGLMYEILMYLNSFYFGLYAAFKTCVCVLKPIYLSYGESVLAREIGILIGIFTLETIRLILGRRNNLSDRSWQAILSVLLTLPSLTAIIYFCYYETYTLKLEIIMSALMIALQAAEIVYACFFICTICRPVTYT